MGKLDSLTNVWGEALDIFWLQVVGIGEAGGLARNGTSYVTGFWNVIWLFLLVLSWKQGIKRGKLAIIDHSRPGVVWLTGIDATMVGGSEFYYHIWSGHCLLLYSASQPIPHIHPHFFGHFHTWERLHNLWKGKDPGLHCSGTVQSFPQSIATWDLLDFFCCYIIMTNIWQETDSTGSLKTPETAMNLHHEHSDWNKDN